MRKVMILAMVVLTLAAAGCGEAKNAEPSSEKPEPATSNKDIAAQAEVTEGDFVYRLVSDKKAYESDEKVNLYAELEYVGDQDEIQIAHSASPFYFPMIEETRGYEIGYMMNEPFIVTTLKKGVPLKEFYRGGGGYDETQDPKEYVDFMKAFTEASRKGTMPSGEYVVSGMADFMIYTGDSGNNQESDKYRLNTQIKFIVNK
ncbi:hypothetical protein [Paenibacillus glycanilyticus]|uniref:Lipoprotein n=1 Tax=Paenibacillus glycanilyticus TaxID=126569 RepID=A0ABQ6GHF1_9BACL|nr:hypothetical protein [Paenibacillus glycanilyticus]GLX69021.1 hypothetical protein MU1_33660 [Paenibacillus glycanilyticus]